MSYFVGFVWLLWESSVKSLCEIKRVGKEKHDVNYFRNFSRSFSLAKVILKVRTLIRKFSLYCMQFGNIFIHAKPIYCLKSWLLHRVMSYGIRKFAEARLYLNCSIKWVLLRVSDISHWILLMFRLFQFNIIVMLYVWWCDIMCWRSIKFW